MKIIAFDFIIIAENQLWTCSEILLLFFCERRAFQYLVFCAWYALSLSQETIICYSMTNDHQATQLDHLLSALTMDHRKCHLCIFLRQLNMHLSRLVVCRLHNSVSGPIFLINKVLNFMHHENIRTVKPKNMDHINWVEWERIDAQEMFIYQCVCGTYELIKCY